MTSLSITKHIAAPPERVFQLSTDIESWAERISGIVKVEVLTQGPVGVGTRFRETRIVFKKESTEEMEFTAFEPGKHYAVGAISCGCQFETRFDFVPDEGGTRVEMKMESKPLTFMAKLMSPIGALMAGSMRKMIEKDLDELKAAAESA